MKVSKRPQYGWKQKEKCIVLPWCPHGTQHVLMKVEKTSLLRFQNGILTLGRVRNPISRTHHEKEMVARGDIEFELVFNLLVTVPWGITYQIAFL